MKKLFPILILFIAISCSNNNELKKTEISENLTIKVFDSNENLLTEDSKGKLSGDYKIVRVYDDKDKLLTENIIGD
jgi:hypothetical protein